MLKPYFFLVACCLAILSCKAQYPTYSLRLIDSFEDFSGVYLKDTFNDLDKFVGTWLYQDGNTSLTIKLRKIEQNYNGEWYHDGLVGEYRYVKNGNEIINYLPGFNSPLVNNAQHSIDGYQLRFPNRPPECKECPEAPMRVYLNLTDKDFNYLDNEVRVEHIDGSPEKIKIRLNTGRTTTIQEGLPLEPRVPYGTYVLTKQ